jgi:hypothetical protein
MLTDDADSRLSSTALTGTWSKIEEAINDGRVEYHAVELSPPAEPKRVG